MSPVMVKENKLDNINYKKQQSKHNKISSSNDCHFAALQ